MDAIKAAHQAIGCTYAKKDPKNALTIVKMNQYDFYVYFEKMGTIWTLDKIHTFLLEINAYLYSTNQPHMTWKARLLERTLGNGQKMPFGIHVYVTITLPFSGNWGDE